MPAVLTTPFVVVVGTVSPDERMRAHIQTRANAFSQQWLSWQHQPVRMVKDTEVTVELEQAYSLILIGGSGCKRGHATDREKAALCNIP